MKIKSLLFATFAMLLTVACEPVPSDGPDTPDTPETPEVLVSVNPTSIEFTAEGGEQTVILTAKEDWTAKASAKWIVITTLSGKAGDAIEFEILADENTEFESREGKVTFTVGDQKAVLIVTQEAAEENGGDDVVTEPNILDFFINPEGGYSGYSYNPTLLDSNYGPGYTLILIAGSDMAVFTLLDYDYAAAGCSTFSYLTNHNYPPLAGDKTTAPEKSGYVVDSSMTYFYIGGTTYYPVLPESPTDENGNLYGFNLLWTAMPQRDMSVCDIRVPVVDNNGNQKVVVGGFSGALDYEIELAPSTFDLDTFGFTAFEYISNDNKVVTIESQSLNGSFVMKFTTEGTIDTTGATQYSIENSTLTGYFFNIENEAKFVFESGSVALVALGENAYTLSVKNDIVFSAPGLYALKIAAGDYNITINNLP